jgi:hypothetical protein
MIPRVLLPIGFFVATVAIVSAACSTEADSASAQIKTSPMTGQKAQDPRFLAADLPLLPLGVTSAIRPLAVMRVTYEFAARHPEVMHYVPCFCGCERGGHKDNHDCFVTARGADDKILGWETHALGCEVCVDIAYQASQMYGAGSSVSAIRDAIEKKYAGHPGGGHTPTPMPPKGGRGTY